MLVLSRKFGQRFRIGDDVQITIVKVDRHSVRIGIEAPGDVGIYREELSESDRRRVIRAVGEFESAEAPTTPHLAA